jgi:hypothetical protein
MNARTKIVGIAALALIGAGVGLGLAVSGGASVAPQPVVVQPADQPVVASSSASVAVSSPTAVTVNTPAVAPTEAAVTAASIPAPAKTTPRETLVVQGPGTTGNDGVLRPPAPTYVVATPCETPTDYALGTTLSNPCP